MSETYYEAKVVDDMQDTIESLKRELAESKRWHEEAKRMNKIVSTDYLAQKEKLSLATEALEMNAGNIHHPEKCREALTKIKAQQ